MERRKFLQNSLGCSLAILPITKILSRQEALFLHNGLNGPVRPINIYNNWSSYDELSDNIKLTEELAMKELGEVLRLKKHGVHIDYYMMDAFWFDKHGGYREWNKDHWPNGPDAWLNACKQNNIKTGMWFSTNLVTMGGQQVLDIIPEWKDSVGTDPNIMCLFEGGYLKHLHETLQFWSDKGIGAFKFDFAYFSAATKEAKEKYTPTEIEEKNKVAFMEMLKSFRIKNPHVLITGYNGFGGDMENTFTPFRKTVDHRWLDVFDTLYSGDPRFSDIPMMNIWRSQDCYSDHMVRQFEFNGLPFKRIDNCAFMIGKTGTCYRRATQAWKGMLILEFARGGWANVFHGNLELLLDADMSWFARVQEMYIELQVANKIRSYGEIPGLARPFGYIAESKRGTLCTLINPSQEILTIPIPAGQGQKVKVLYHDSGYLPAIKGNKLKIGAEQLVIVGIDGYADHNYDLGTDKDIKIPATIDKLKFIHFKKELNSTEGEVNIVPNKSIRILVQQFDKNGMPRRSWGGAPPDGKKMNELIKITVQQGGKDIPMRIEYDKMIWSGLSWGAAEIDNQLLNPSLPLTIRCSSIETDPLDIKVQVYALTYS